MGASSDSSGVKKPARRGRTGAFPIVDVLETVRTAVALLPQPVVTVLAQHECDPFLVLVSTVLSLRTKDATTAAASARLFAHARTPEALLGLSEDRVAELIYPVGFYRTKARSLRELARVLIEQHGGRVPSTIDELLKLPGVGRKTANLTLTLGFGLPGICVDVHVHRIVNRWGYVRTANPDATEMELRRRLPGAYWIPINDWLVAYGQHVCQPVSPYCSRCAVAEHCARIGVKRSR